jgi:uncharacterized protein YndB with AHSA1/START domain
MTATVTPSTFASFTIERTFKASPKRVFAAWSTAEAKAKWFAGGPGWNEQIREFNFREGGEDRLVGVWKGAPTEDFHAGLDATSDFRNRYWEIIPEKRIVYTYDMHLNGVRISVSLATIEFNQSGTGTKMKLTEQGAFLAPFDPKGDDNGQRKQGTIELVDKLEKFLDGK